MELELTKNNEINVDDNILNATSTVKEAFNNTLDKSIDNLDVDEGMLGKIKSGIKKVNIKEVASDTIDTALKTSLKMVAGVKAKTIDSVKNLGKAIRDCDLKEGLKNVVHLGVDAIKGIPTSVKNVVKNGIDLALGDTFDNELQEVMVKQKNTLSRLDKKCDNFEKAFKDNDEKAMKKYVKGINTDLEKISLISSTIDRAKGILNQYELMQNKGSTELDPIEQELCNKLA